MLLSAVILVGSVSASLGLLMTARGPVRPSKEAVELATSAEDRARALADCVTTVNALAKEVVLFREVVSASRVLDLEAPSPEGSPKPKKPQPAFAGKAWPAAKNTHEASRRLIECRDKTAAVAIPHDIAKEGWAAVEAVGKVVAPEANPSAQLSAAKAVFAAVEKAPIPSVVDHVTFAAETAAIDAARLRQASDQALVQEPLPRGLLGREVAMFAGVTLSVVALLLSVFSLRARASRRAAALQPYRKAARAPERGIQAATIIRLASEPNGGEPGIVVGAAALGLIAAGVFRADADWYVVGVMLGVLLGVVAQMLIRTAGGVTRFRERCLALAEIEKPVVPIVLVLRGVKEGGDDEFLDFFLKLAPSEAAAAVEKLAAAAEEEILIAADAAR